MSDKRIHQLEQLLDALAANGPNPTAESFQQDIQRIKHLLRLPEVPVDEQIAALWHRIIENRDRARRLLESL